MVLTETTVYSRVVGYIRPVDNWNDAKQSESSDRIEFDSITPDLFKGQVYIEPNRIFIQMLEQGR